MMRIEAKSMRFANSIQDIIDRANKRLLTWASIDKILK